MELTPGRKDRQDGRWRRIGSAIMVAMPGNTAKLIVVMACSAFSTKGSLLGVMLYPYVVAMIMLADMLSKREKGRTPGSKKTSSLPVVIPEVFGAGNEISKELVDSGHLNRSVSECCIGFDSLM